MKKNILWVICLTLLLTLLPCTAYAAENTAATSTTLPAPVLTDVCNTESGVQVTWKAVSGAVRYRVMWKQSGGSWHTAGSTTKTMYHVTGLTELETYIFSVRCVSEDGKTAVGTYDKDGLSIIYESTLRPKRIYLSPSDQVRNTYAYGNTTEAVECGHIADALENALVRCGFYVKNNQTDSMAQRVEESNNWRADLHLPLHTNAFNGKVSGTRIFTYNKTGEGYACAQEIFKYLAPLTPGTSESITVDSSLYEIRYSTAPCVYIESEFHDVPEVSQWIVEHTRDIGEAICHGICDYFGEEYVADKPLLQSVTNKANGIVLKWAPVTGATNYRIYRSEDGKSYQYYDKTDKTAFTDTAVQGGTKYFYKIKSVSYVKDTAFRSSYSDAKSAVALAAPTVTVKLTAGNVKLSWEAVTGAEQYDIYRSTDGENYTYYATTAKTAYANSKVEQGRTYYYKVKAVCHVDEKTYTSVYSKVLTAHVLDVPTVTAARKNGYIALSWNAVDGAGKYWVYRSTDGEHFSYYCKVNDTAYADKTVKPGVKYSYKVRSALSVDGVNWYSGYSDVKSTVTLATPTATVKLTAGKVRLSWNAVSGAEQYNIYRSTDGENYTRYATTAKTAYTNSKVEQGKTYYYKVKAVCRVDGKTYTSCYSKVHTAYVLRAPAVTIARKNGSMVLNWKAVKKAGKYWVYRSTDGEHFAYYCRVNDTTYTDSKVKQGVKYYYKVKSVLSVDGVNWSSRNSNTVSRLR